MSIFCADVPGRVFGNHYVNEFVELQYLKEDKAILRDLAKRYMEIASLPRQQENIRKWRDLNSLRSSRPLVWHNEICWNEMNVDDELTLKTSSEFARRIESELRRNIYLWKHMSGDMVVEPVVYSPVIVENTGIGVEVEEATVSTEEDNQIVAHSFKPQITTEDDLEKLVAPKVTYQRKQSEDMLQAYEDMLGDIVPVKLRGYPGFWFAPWDDIVTFMGVENTLINLYEEPELMHHLIGKIVDIYIQALDQYEAQGCIATNNKNFRIGSGAYGYCDDLPETGDFGVTCKEIWGSATPQIFTSVSPEMHDEYAIQYERKWLEKFGLAYYGCCEALHNKIEILSKIKNLRKISISPWSDVKMAAEHIGRKYVISLKPSPSIFAEDTWDLERARQELKEKLIEARGCNVEIVMKDISTVRHQPQRLWQWMKMAHELVQDF